MSAKIDQELMRICSSNDSNVFRGVPTLQGSFTNWQPISLTPLTDFCLANQTRQEPDHFSDLKQQFKIRETVKSVKECDDTELGRIEKLKVKFREQSMQEWPQTVLQALKPYRKPHFLNGVEMVRFIESGQRAAQLYIGVFFGRPGEH